MPEVKWIKITTTMFDDEKIDFIESLPDCDTILIIWVKLLTLAGKCNVGGYIMLTDTIPYTDDMLAHKFKRNKNTIRLALDTFAKLGMIDVDEDNKIHITNWEKHQSAEKLDAIREYNRLAKQKERDKKKLLSQGNVIDSQADVNTQMLDIDIDKEKDVVVNPEQFYNQNFGLITPYIADDINNFINDGVEEALIVRLMQEALKNNVNNWKYVSKSLINLMSKNIKTLELYEANEAKRARGKVKQEAPRPRYEVIRATDEFKSANG